MTQSTQAIGTIIAALFAAPAMAQAPIAHFSMDGSPAPGEAYPAGASLQSVPGRHGQALKFDGQTVIAHPLDLEQHRRLTVTAWVKLDDTDEAGGFIASAGNGPGGPRLKINHRSDQLMVNVARAGMRVSREVPANEWTFVAVAVDLDAGEGRLQMGDAIDASDRLETDPNRVGQSAYDEPDDPDAAKRRYLFIGAQDFNMRQPATAMAIDDVRVYAAELNETEIDALRGPQATAVYQGPGASAILHDPYGEPDVQEDDPLLGEAPAGTGAGSDPELAEPVAAPDGAPGLPDPEAQAEAATEIAQEQAIEEAEARAEERRRQELLDWAEEERARRENETEEAEADMADGVEKHAPGAQGPTATIEYFLPGASESVEIEYEIFDGLAVAEGDIILGEHEALQQARSNRAACSGETCTVRSPLLARADESHHWPSGVVPYEVSDQLPWHVRQEIEDAIAMIHADTNILLKPRDGEYNYVDFTSKANNCSSRVGRVGRGRQRIRLSDECTAGSIVHEILHAVGVWHEQSRPDRDEFVSVIEEDVKWHKRHNFKIKDSNVLVLGPYDYESIMHYPSTAFGETDDDGEPKTTIVPKDPSASIGNRERLSPGDIAGLNALYADQDCVRFDPEGAELKMVLRNGLPHWGLYEGEHGIADLGVVPDDAETALEIIRHYGMNRICFVGRPDPSMTYFLVDGAAPNGAYPGETCEPIDPNRTEIRSVRTGGVITRGESWRWARHSDASVITAVGAFPSANEAYKSLDIARQHAFTQACFVGLPDPNLMYFRR